MAAQITLGIISHQRIARSMAGPGIRCWELARALAGDAEVILFTPEASDLEPEGFRLLAYHRESLVEQAAQCDVLLFQGFILSEYPQLGQLGKYLIIDLYVPMTLEALAQYEHVSTVEQNRIQDHILLSLAEQLAAGHFFICASERQRDFWLGMLSAQGRINAVAFQEDGALRQLIDVVPFGIPTEAPAATGAVLKGVHPGIAATDKLLLWGGGIYNWLDPFTPIRAMGELAASNSEIKLYFLGTRHPDPNVPKMRVYDEAVALSRELGVLDKNVFFNDQWVQYADRVNYLLEADLGVSANIPHVETRFSFRTRILDCLWSSLPVVATDGDSLSDMIAGRELGLVVPSGDYRALAQAVVRLLGDATLYGRCRQNLAAVAADFQWQNATAPLKRVLSPLEPRTFHAAPSLLGLGERVRWLQGQSGGDVGWQGQLHRLCRVAARSRRLRALARRAKAKLRA